MKITLNARKAAKKSRGRAKSRSVNYKAHYMKYGRRYYEKNRTKILKRAKARYAANKGKYKRMRKRWLAKTAKGTRPLYMSGKGAGRRPKFPRLKGLHVRSSTRKVGRRPGRSGRAFKSIKYKPLTPWGKKRSRAAKKAWRARRAKS